MGKDLSNSVEAARSALRCAAFKVHRNGKARIRRDELTPDLMAWVVGLVLVTVGGHAAHGGPTDLTGIVFLVLTAAVLQSGLGTFHGLYTGDRRYGTHTEFGACVIVAICVAAGLMLATILLDARTIPPLSLPFAALLAVGIMAVPRRVRNTRRRPEKRKPRWFVERQVSVRLDEALPLAEEIVEELSRCDAVVRCSYGGSVRRMKATVSDIDIVVASERPAAVVEAFVALPQIRGVWVAKKLERETKVNAVSVQGVKIQLKIVLPGAYGATSLYWTGGRAHTRQLRRRALVRRYRFSWGPELQSVKEYWLFRLTNPRASSSRELPRPLETEEEVYRCLGMQWIPPPLREGRGEIGAATRGDLPHLVEYVNMKGAISCLPAGSGSTPATLRRFALAAAYCGHSHLVFIENFGQFNNGKADGLKRQREVVDLLNDELSDQICLLFGVEIPLAPTGELTCSDPLLEEVDLVLAVGGGANSLSGRALTAQMLNAIDHPRVNVIAFPPDLQHGIRNSISFDVPAICQAAARRGVAIEVGERPGFVDCPYRRTLRGRETGVRVALSSVAPTPGQIQRIRLSVGKAQRRWLEADSVINTWPLATLQTFLSKGRTSTREAPNR